MTRMTHSLSDFVAPYRSHIQQGTKAIFGLLFAIFALKYLRVIWDNLSIWSFANFVIINPAVTIYDNSILQKFQESLGAAPYTHVPYPYPPSFLLLSLPLGFMSYYVAYGVWVFSTFVFYCIASFYRQWRASAALITLLAPATILTFTFGQTGFLSSALIVGGFRLAGSRPIQSGVLLGLVSLKPQLGILIPVALISARLWRTLIAAGLTVLVLVLASSVAFGWSIWPIWLAKTPRLC